MNPPSSILLSYNLYPKGTIEVGYEAYKGGLTAGGPRLLARIQIPEDCGKYPDGWFPIGSSLGKIKGDIQRERLTNTDLYSIPRWILIDCYRYHWEILSNKI